MEAVFYGFVNENIMNIEFMCGLLANYSKELSEVETYREKGDVQLKHAKLILDKVKNCSIPAVVGRSEQLKAFVDEFIESWEDGNAGDSDLYRKAKSL